MASAFRRVGRANLVTTARADLARQHHVNVRHNRKTAGLAHVTMRFESQLKAVRGPLVILTCCNSTSSSPQSPVDSPTKGTRVRGTSLNRSGSSPSARRRAEYLRVEDISPIAEWLPVPTLCWRLDNGTRLSPFKHGGGLCQDSPSSVLLLATAICERSASQLRSPFEGLNRGPPKDTFTSNEKYGRSGAASSVCGVFRFDGRHTDMFTARTVVG